MAGETQWACKGRGGLAAAKSLQLCPTLGDPIDGSPPGSPIPGILQARTLESGAWRGMQIQTSTWESCSACQWTQLALGLPCALSDCACLGGEKTSLLPGPYPSTAHTQEEARALRARGAGELGLETQPAPGVGCAACPFKQEAFDMSARQGPQLPLPGIHFFPNIHDSKEP